MARLSIGEFAHASGLTPKALRLYDELGLLRPAEVDPRSGYRSYDHAQLELARLVASLRGLGMPLARIRVVCSLPPRAAAAEIASYWRQVEADTAARKTQAALLIEDLSRKDTDMSEETPLKLACAGRTDQGLVRAENQDDIFCGNRLFAVADGFGAQGLVRAASSVALEALAAIDGQPPGSDPLEVLESAFHAAGDAVEDFTDSEAADSDCGTTVTAMFWAGARFALAHIGDSRSYLLRGSELCQLTHDHSYVQSLVDEGKLTADEAAAHPDRPRLLRALYRNHPAKPDIHLREAHLGDRYLLCSDGLHAVLDEHTLRGALADSGDAEDVVERLVKLATDAGAPDNLACLVIDVLAAETL